MNDWQLIGNEPEMVVAAMRFANKAEADLYINNFLGKLLCQTRHLFVGLEKVHGDLWIKWLCERLQEKDHLMKTHSLTRLIECQMTLIDKNLDMNRGFSLNVWKFNGDYIPRGSDLLVGLYFDPSIWEIGSTVNLIFKGWNNQEIIEIVPLKLARRTGWYTIFPSEFYFHINLKFHVCHFENPLQKSVQAVGICLGSTIRNKLSKDSLFYPRWEKLSNGQVLGDDIGEGLPFTMLNYSEVYEADCANKIKFHMKRHAQKRRAQKGFKIVHGELLSLPGANDYLAAERDFENFK